MYEIIIKKIAKKMKNKRGSWEVIRESFWTKEDLEKEDYYEKNKILKTFEKKIADGNIPTKRVFGYTPDREEEEDIETVILKQTVEDLDLTEVIKAINKINGK